MIMISIRIRPFLFTSAYRCARRCVASAAVDQIDTNQREHQNASRISKKLIKQSMYAYKRFQTTYYDWMEAVNRVDVQQSAFYRPLVVRATIRQILRYMHDAFINIEQWTTFRDYLVKKDIGVSRLFDGIFLHECINHQRFLMGLSYVAYLRHEQIPLTPTGLAMLLSLARQIDIRPELAEYRLDEKTILDAHTEFLSHQIVPDSMLALPLIAGLTLIEKWKEALKYLPILDNDLDGMQQALGFVLTAAAKFHDYDFFFSLIDNISQTEEIRMREKRERKRENRDEKKKPLTLDEQVKRPLAPSNVKESDYYLIAKTSQAYQTFIDYLTGNKDRQIETIIQLLDKTAKNGYLPPLSFVQALERKLNQYDPVRYKCEYINFYPDGTSLDGKSTLPSITPSDSECQNLHSFVRENFHSLIQFHCPKLAEDPSKLIANLNDQPFDVIFDCLHYPTLELDWRIRHPLYIKRILYQIADEKGKRCLVIAKIDLADYVESLEMPVDLVTVVRVPYESIQSPLPLLAALFHSPTTLLASPVDQRSFKNILGLNNVDVFDRWIQTQQLVPTAKPDLVYLQAPCLYTTRVHLGTNEWLIPYFDGSPLTDAERVQTWFRVQINH